MIDGIYFTKFPDSSLSIVSRINGKTSLYWSTIGNSLKDNIIHDIFSDQKELKIPMEFVRSTN